MASKFKYGIKPAATEYTAGRKKIEALTRFRSGNVVEGFTEITEANYNRWSPIKPYNYWDESKKTVEVDEAIRSSFNNSMEKLGLRERLKFLKFEIEFTNELGESTTELQNEYDTLLSQYNPIEE